MEVLCQTVQSGRIMAKNVPVEPDPHGHTMRGGQARGKRFGMLAFVRLSCGRGDLLALDVRGCGGVGLRQRVARPGTGAASWGYTVAVARDFYSDGQGTHRHCPLALVIGDVGSSIFVELAARPICFGRKKGLDL